MESHAHTSSKSTHSITHNLLQMRSPSLRHTSAFSQGKPMALTPSCFRSFVSSQNLCATFEATLLSSPLMIFHSPMGLDMTSSWQPPQPVHEPIPEPVPEPDPEPVPDPFLH